MADGGETDSIYAATYSGVRLGSPMLLVIMADADFPVYPRYQCSSTKSREVMSCVDATMITSMLPTSSKSPSMTNQLGRGYLRERSRKECTRKSREDMENTRVKTSVLLPLSTSVSNIP